VTFDESKMTLAGSLNVQSSTAVGGNLTVGSATSGARSLTVQATSGAANMVLQSNNGASALTVEAGSGSDATIKLGTSADNVQLVHGSSKFSVKKGSTELLTMSPLEGHTEMPGSLTIGAATETNARSIAVLSKGSAAMKVTAAGGSASVSLTSAAGADTKVSLTKTGGASFHMINHGSSDKFSISDGSVDLMSITPANGNTQIAGSLSVGDQLSVIDGLTVGGATATGSKTLSVSSSGPANAVVKSGSQASLINLIAGNGKDSTIKLGQQTSGSTYSIVASAASGALLLKEQATSQSAAEATTLLSLSSSNGIQVNAGNLTVGGSSSPDPEARTSSLGARSLSVQSSDAAAELSIAAGVSSRLNLVSGESGNASLYLGQPSNQGFNIIGAAADQSLTISSAQKDVLKIASSGKTSLHGSLTVDNDINTTGSLIITVGATLTITTAIQRACPSSEGVSSARWAGNNHCYMLVQSLEHSFTNAQAYCEAHGGYLATLKSPQESSFVRTELQPKAKKDFYIGYTKLPSSSSFQWVTGEIAVLNNTHLYNNWEAVDTLSSNSLNCAAYYTAVEDGGSTYRGTVSQTSNGLSCRSWTSVTPHGEVFNNPAQYPTAGLGDHNYCRNPDGRSAAFCVTTDTNVVTASCDVSGVWRNTECSNTKPFLCERDY